MNLSSHNALSRQVWSEKDRRRSPREFYLSLAADFLFSAKAFFVVVGECAMKNDFSIRHAALHNAQINCWRKIQNLSTLMMACWVINAHVCIMVNLVEREIKITDIKFHYLYHGRSAATSLMQFLSLSSQ